MLGKFIVFEGGEGTGKTTQINLLIKKFKKNHLPVLLTREPGGTNCTIAEKIRKLLKAPEHKEFQPKCELFLFLASRAQHVEQIIKPSLQKGINVICDRFFGSTLAYQHYGRGLFKYEEIKNLNNFATGGLTPDLTILLDINPELGLRRKGNLTHDRLDNENLEFHQKVRAGYLNIAKKENNWQIIDATATIDIIQKQVWEKVSQTLKLKQQHGGF